MRGFKFKIHILFFPVFGPDSANHAYSVASLIVIVFKQALKGKHELEVYLRIQKKDSSAATDNEKGGKNCPNPLGCFA